MPTPKTYSFSLPSTLTGNAIVDSLISGTYWLGANWTPTGPTNLSYSFMAPGTSYFVIDYSPDNEYNALYELTTGQKNAVTSALGAWSAVANLNFTLTTDTISNVGDMRFGGYRLMDDKTAAWAYFPSNTPVAGDVWIGPQTNDANPGKGSYDYLTFVHEIGHALGLKHPFDTSSTNNTLLDPTLDDVHFTVMSYNSNYSYQPTTPMVLDIIAIQSLYGANMAWQAGDTVYKWAANQSIFETIWDGGGNDTIDGSNQLAAVSINLNEGAYSQIGKAFVDYNNLTAINDGLAIAYGAKIENAVGSEFNDILTGNALNNTLDGGAGADTMSGGDGVDTYYVDNVGDVVIETDASLTALDRVFSSIDYILGANVENLILTGTANLNGTGNSVNNRMTGNDGNNVLDGGLGADTLIGGLGNDTYIVDNLGDTVTETSTLISEIDTVRSSVDFTLGANLENLVLTGNAVNGTGNALNNTLTGNAAANTLDGGVGADTMIGGDGVDTYYVDNVGDVVIETDASLTALDRVFSSIDYTLGANVENLILTGTANLNGTGNSVNNRMTGNIGNNILDGGMGVDTMIGGAGNDTYVVDNINDVVIEQVGEGHDLIRTSSSYTLGANVEDLTMTGSADGSLTGNALENVITGNAGTNYIDGGLGADTLIGGGGGDVYLVDNINDVVIELADGGNDSVWTSVDYTLSDNVEDGMMIGNNNLNLTGNALNNNLNGNEGDNILSGGLGADRMFGAGGDDTYIVDNVNDVVLEAPDKGHDLVRTSVDYTLGDNVEDGTLLGSADLSLWGNNLDNILTGNSGNNVIWGYDGIDKLYGGAGNDTLYGGLGNTTLNGGTGADSFAFTNLFLMNAGVPGGGPHNVIADFNALEGDKIDFSDFDSSPNTLGLQHMTFIGSNEFTGFGQLRFVDQVLSGNMSPNEGGYFEVQLVGVHSFSANDVIV
ncbi:matrixin family metalloprotease [Pseudomonas atacamensis]|uniref:M10 family metallopeptidase C-terminal domain-containing protein n=1 Tax=Pseudomonas atacamensis TaxID=2565368 RepID=UPI002B478342|nr:matrixin family metalloprotease [Pseudomonas atacamensis]MEB2855005.1 matrixin family metalloprotease [Pseudomonas atacamensis]